MNYEEFLSYVRKKVQEILGDSARVELHHILKNNSVAKDGLLILEEGRSISPTIYLNSFYMYKNFQFPHQIKLVLDPLLTI